MMVKIFTETKDEPLKEPQIMLRGTDLEAISDEGKNIAYIYSFASMEACTNAFTLLAMEGYRTDFAEWGEDGAMIKLLEDFG